MASNDQSNTWSLMSESTMIEQFPLHRACRDGDSVLLSNLLPKYKSHITLEDTYYGWTPSHWAAYFGKLDCLRMLVMGGLLTTNTAADLRTSRFNQTPSHIAAFAGHPHCLQWLTQAGADPNSKDYLGESPLHKAARTGSLECISFLVNINADIGLKNNSNQTSTDLAKNSGFPNIVSYLSSLQNKGSLLSYVSVGGHYGFHPKPVGLENLSNGKHDSEMEMEIESTQQSSNGIHRQTTFNGTNKLLTNSGDITLDMNVSQNKVGIGGKKRNCEEAFSEQEIKRMRMEGPENPAPVRFPQTSGRQMANNNGKDFCPTNNCSLGEHYQSVVVEKGYDSLKFQMLMNDAHGC